MQDSTSIHDMSELQNITKDEKLRLLTGDGAWHTYDCNGKLKSIMMTDGPHGIRKQLTDNTEDNNNSAKATCFPTESAIACSWDTEAVEEMAKAIAREAKQEHISIVLGCGANIKRSPLCGRNFEYFSEDPFLSGEMAAAYISAMEDEGVGTSLKHFAGNNQETRRMTSNSQIDKRALHEIYLSAFEKAVKTGNPSTVMVSYNKLNSCYTCENKWLLTDTLKNRWGYKGTTISDWGAVVNLSKCIKAGLDLEMPDSCGIHTKQLKEDLENGKIEEKDIDRAANSVISLVNKLANNNNDTDFEVDYENQNAIAQKLAEQCAVLLKNDGMLPVPMGSEIVVIGDMAKNVRFEGGGSSHVNATRVPDIVKALTDIGYKVRYAKGYSSENEASDINLENEALKISDVKLPILFFGGLTEIIEGEGYDRKSIAIPKNQTELFDKIYEINHNIAFISFGGAPMTMQFKEKARAILHMYLGGQAVDLACARLITGEVCPNGKLAETFPYSEKDTPCYKYFGNESNDVEYRESIFVGYRYYDTFGKKVMYPFGYGLSYTTFEYFDINIEVENQDINTQDINTQNTKNEPVRVIVSFKIKNTGDFSGKEIAQIYVKNPECNYIRANKELRGFAKVSLDPGEEKTIKVTLDSRSFSIYNVECEDFSVVAGNYIIEVGSSSVDIRLTKDIYVNGIDYNRNDRELLSEYFNHNNDLFEISKQQFKSLYQGELSNFDCKKKGEYSTYDSIEELSKHSLIGRITLLVLTREVYKMFKGLSHDDPQVLMILNGARTGTIDCLVSQSKGVLPYKLAEAIVLSANGHKIKSIIKLLSK